MNYKYLIIVFCILFAFSCGNEYVLDEYFDLEELPGYVAFNAPGNDIALADVMAEEGGAVDPAVIIECPTGTLSDITVNYTWSGTAVLGTDFNLPGATAAGTGTAVIQHKPADPAFRDRVELEIELLTDDVVDGQKTLTFTLVSASNAEGEVAVGRGGRDFLKTAGVIIDDIDPGTISGSVTERVIMGTDTTFNSIEGVVITLDDKDPNTTDLTATTDADGNYEFANVAPGTYTLVQAQPAGFTSISDFDSSVDDDDMDGDDSAAGSNDQIPVILAPGGEEDSGNDFIEESP